MSCFPGSPKVREYFVQSECVAILSTAFVRNETLSGLGNEAWSVRLVRFPNMPFLEHLCTGVEQKGRLVAQKSPPPLNNDQQTVHCAGEGSGWENLTTISTRKRHFWPNEMFDFLALSRVSFNPSSGSEGEEKACFQKSFSIKAEGRKANWPALNNTRSFLDS